MLRCLVNRWVAACLLVGGAVFPAAAEERLAGPVPASVIEVVDGDTLSVRAHIWLGQEVRTRVRLVGIDAPEIAGACPRERRLARQAQRFLVGFLLPVDGRPAEVRLRDVRYGKYARRVLARVETVAGQDLGQALLAAELARPYDGGQRASWCD